MTIDIKKCDLNNDYFHFTNKKNINGILNKGLIPSIGAASSLVGDRPNVSVSKGGKGIMGIINSFIYKFANEISISEIPYEYRKYFTEITNFNSDEIISKDIVCKAMTRKLKDEVYFRVRLSEEQLKEAKIGGLTGYDVNLPFKIDSANLDIVTDSDNKVLSAYDVARHIYERTKNIDIFRNMHEDFFYMLEMEEKDKNTVHDLEDDER